MLVIDPTQRYTIDHVRHHPWLLRSGSEMEIPTEPHERSAVEPKVTVQLLSVGFRTEDVEQSVGLDKHDHLNTAYQVTAARPMPPRVLAAAMASHTHT